jgi:transcriptional regulator with PAS, ATPase and Fis domain
LSTWELKLRKDQNKAFLEVASIQIRELYRFVAGSGFAVAIVDGEGYILDNIGDRSMLEKLEKANCFPGFRWSEKDVGTSAIGVTLARKAPIQVTAAEHFCNRAHGHTCSASPVFGDGNSLTGIIAMTGEATRVHPHTLGMVITAAKAIENQLRIMRTSQELLLRNNYMNAIIESIDSGVLAVDKEGLVTQINKQGRRILDRYDNLERKPISALLGSQDELRENVSSGYTDREIFIKAPRKTVQLVATAKPIFDSSGKMQGSIFVFHEIHRIRKLINSMAGTPARFTFEDIIGMSPPLQEAKRLSMLAAASKSNVLLLGETGTGKELFAQSIHNLSDRRNHPFVAINCGAIPRELLESELFGYVEGSFTGAKKGGRPGKLELADGGTVFLDEIGDMPVDMQVKLLRVLQSGEIYRIGQHKPISVDIRIIAASYVDIKQEVERGNFREDLFYRLNVLPIEIPPLRERSGDLRLIGRHILNRCRQTLGKPDVKFSPEAEKALTSYHWPGNVRELENVIERAVNLVDGVVIHPQHFGPLALTKTKAHFTGRKGSLLEDLEKQAIAEALTGMSKSKAAEVLGITRATLYRKLKRYKIHKLNQMFKNDT